MILDQQLKQNLGPLAKLAGIWEGQKGNDVAPGDDRGVEKNQYTERMVFEPMGPVQNHEQVLYGLRYSTKAIRVGEAEPFHEELGYWLWDAKAHQVMRCFLVPRGIALIAGGTVPPDATEFLLTAKLGSQTYGVCSNLFLDEEFQTTEYNFKLIFQGENQFSYEQDTVIKMKNKKDLFHHTDQNVMRRVQE